MCINVNIPALCLSFFIVFPCYAGEHKTDELLNEGDTFNLRGKNYQNNINNRKQTVIVKKQTKKIEFIIGGQSTDGLPKRLQLSINK